MIFHRLGILNAKLTIDISAIFRENNGRSSRNSFALIFPSTVHLRFGLS